MLDTDPRPRPDADCGMCEDYIQWGQQICPCSCHVAGNYLRGYHHHFNAIPAVFVEDDFKRKNPTWRRRI